MKTKKHRLRQAFAAVALAGIAATGIAGCAKPADTVSKNLSTAADNFRINRQIDFVNTITGENLLTIRGLCSLGNTDKAGELTVTCKTGEDKNGHGQYVKDFLGLSPTVTYVVQQIGSAEVDSAHYSVTWNPGTLVPDFNNAGGDPLTTQPDTSTTTQPGATPSSETTPTIKVVPLPAPSAGG